MFSKYSIERTPMKKILLKTIFVSSLAVLASSCATKSTTPTETENKSSLYHFSLDPYESEENLIRAVAYLTETDATRLHNEYIWQTLANREDDPAVDAAFKLAMQKKTMDAQLDLLRAIELKFIHDKHASVLDMLGPELSDHFRNFDWQHEDYPGGDPPGENELVADYMVDALDVVSPERRANRTRESVVMRHEATEEIWDYMLNQWVLIEGEDHWMLNKHAAESFAKMREAAKAEGVDLQIKSAHRTPKKAADNAARAGNPYAVASFSAHSLGLAVDFQMSQPGLEFAEVTTRPMADVVKMRESPVHKWLHLRGREHGWFPYQNEPWHWEYNPEGFRDLFFADFPGGAPERPLE